MTTLLIYILGGILSVILVADILRRNYSDDEFSGGIIAYPTAFLFSWAAFVILLVIDERSKRRNNSKNS